VRKLMDEIGTLGMSSPPAEKKMPKPRPPNQTPTSGANVTPLGEKKEKTPGPSQAPSAQAEQACGL